MNTPIGLASTERPWSQIKSAQFFAQVSALRAVPNFEAPSTAGHVRSLREIYCERPPEDRVHSSARVGPTGAKYARCCSLGKSCEVRLSHHGRELIHQRLRVSRGITNEWIVQHHAILFRIIHHRDAPG